jgi:hypothetical protein
MRAIASGLLPSNPVEGFILIWSISRPDFVPDKGPTDTPYASNEHNSPTITPVDSGCKENAG